MSSAKPSHKRELVYALNPNDVLLGRGQHTRHEGNQRFVALVRSRVREYNSVDSQAKTAKDLVARQIIKDVEALGGRFVRKVQDSSVAAAAAGVSEYEDVWEIADRATVLVKIKQTFRDYSVIRRKAAAAAASNGNTVAAMPSPKPRTPVPAASPAAQRQPNNLTPLSGSMDRVESTAALENHASMTIPNEGHSLAQLMPDSVGAGRESHANSSATLLQQLLLLQQQQQASASQPLLQARDALMLPPELLLQLLNNRGPSTVGAVPSLGQSQIQTGSLGAAGTLPPPPSSSPLAQSSSYQLMNAAALAEARVNAALYSNQTHQSDDAHLRQMASGILPTDRLESMQRQLLIQQLMSSFTAATATTSTTASQPSELFPSSAPSSLSSGLWPSQQSSGLPDNLLDTNLPAASMAASSSDLAQVLARLAPPQNLTRAAAADSAHVNGASSFDTANDDMERKPPPRQRRPDP